MKQLLLLFAVLAITSAVTAQQKQVFPTKAKDGQTEMIDSRIDNMGY